MNSWSYYKKHFAWINFSHLVPPTIKKKSFCFWVLSVSWSAVSIEVHWKAGLKKQEAMSELELRNQENFNFMVQNCLFPPTLQNAHCLHLCILVFFPPRLCWDYWLLAFHWKITFVIMWCGLLNIVYVAFLVSVKSFKTRMCKIF